jgi:hypothetical protein
MQVAVQLCGRGLFQRRCTVPIEVDAVSAQKGRVTLRRMLLRTRNVLALVAAFCVFTTG